jgi:hypothetical protein
MAVQAGCIVMQVFLDRALSEPRSVVVLGVKRQLQLA